MSMAIDDPLAALEAIRNFAEDGDEAELMDAGLLSDSRPKWLEPAARARAFGGLGERLPLSIEAFNAITRGGLPARKLVVIGGAPGAGKTTFAVQLAVELAGKGAHVAIAAADEDADGLLVRVGQILGFDRDALERGDARERDALAVTLDAIPTLMLVDLDEEEATLEEVSAELHRRASGASTVLIVDSIQTARVAGLEECDGRRAQIDLVMAALKREAKQRGHRVIATCELARGAYRSQTERIDDLAAFKESGAVEYGATVGLVFRCVQGSNTLVDVSVPKNRLGKRDPWRMELSFRTATFRQVDMPAEGTESPLERTKARVLEVVGKAIVPIKSKNELARRAKGNKKTVLAAVDELLEDGDLEVVGGVFGLTGSTGSSSSEPVPEPAPPGSGSAVPALKGGTENRNRFQGEEPQEPPQEAA